jgi:putative zinc finger/helix-turn-helix YgiT family protein
MEKKAYCSKCEQKQHYFIRQEDMTRKIKENSYTLNVKVAHCAVCDEEVYISEISDQTQQTFFNAYRLDHQLLTVDEMINIRKTIGLNQRDFSRLLGFGEITISRYELGSLPNKNNAQLISKISDKKFLEEKYEQNKLFISEDGKRIIEEYLKLKGNTTGKVKYNQDKFFELTYLFVEEAIKNNENMTETKLNKLLFYADFNHYNKVGKGITGSKYLKFQFGPVPNYSQKKYSENPYISFFKTDDDKTQIEIINKPKKWHLSEFEIKMVEAIYSYFKDSNAKKISHISHQENAWTNADLFEAISYEYAKDLKITV